MAAWWSGASADPNDARRDCGKSDYSDLPVMTVAQHRAEAVLLEYGYRTDY